MVSFIDILKRAQSVAESCGNGDNPNIQRVSPPELCQSGDLVFVSTEVHLEMALKNKCSALVASSKIKESLTKLNPTQAWISTASIPLAMSAILPLFDKKPAQYAAGIHQSSIVHEKAELADCVSIGPFSYIGSGAKIGRNVKIGAHVTIEDGAVIGDSTIIHAGAVVAYACQVGQHCELHSNCVIGSDGYGYATDRNKIHHKIPQLGIVKLGNFVEIGANTAIDRATLTVTSIGDYTKIDNLCHIAHNCEIGKGCFITANFAIAGSSKIGDYFVCGGSTSVGDHVHIPENVQLAGATVVTSNLNASGAFGGNPVQPMREYLKTRANLQHLTKFRKQLSQVLKALNIEE